MHERPGPQYNKGNDPTTGICILKNATQKKWYLRFWNIFFFILRWRAESPVVFSGVSRGGAGESGAPLVLDQKEARRSEKNFFLRPGPPFISESGWPNPPPPPIWRSGSATGLIESEGEIEALSESCQTFIPGRWSLQLELANIPFLKPEKCTPFGRSFSV